MIRKIYLLLLLVIFSSILFAQEICTNGIDDDADGFIDCLDSDCYSIPLPSPLVINTGSDGLGGTLLGGANDLHWEVSTGTILGPYTPAIVMSSVPGSYVTSPWPSCDWISYNVDGTHGGFGDMDLYYKLEFDLPCKIGCNLIEVANTFCLGMDFYADNSVYEIYVNGFPQAALVGYTPPPSPYYYAGFFSGASATVSLCNNWQVGTNEIIIHIKSGPGYTGFLAQVSTTVPTTTAGAPQILFADDTTICSHSGIIDLNSSSTTAIWSGNGIIDTINGIFDPSILSVGTYQIFIDDSCGSDSIEIRIREPSDTVDIIQYTCVNDSVLFLGNYYGIGDYVVIIPTSVCDSTISLSILSNTINTGINSNPICIDDTLVVNTSLSDILYDFSWTSSCGIMTNNTSSESYLLATDTGNCYITLIVTDSLGCNHSIIDTVYIKPTITALISTNYICPNVVQVILNTNSNFSSVNYSFGDGNSITSTNDTIINSYNSLGNYTILIEINSSNDCDNEYTVPVVITDTISIVVPNILVKSSTTNNDKFNFNLLTENFDKCVSYLFTIYDRWGVKVFEIENDLLNPLDSNHYFKGKSDLNNDLTEGVYYYTMISNSNIKKSGFIHIFD